VFIEYVVTLPGPDWPASLTFAAGLSDFAKNSDGALFVVRISGTEVWRTDIGRAQLIPAEIDLRRWAGQTVRIRLIIHPGMRLNSTADLACWADLAVTFQSQDSVTRFKIEAPPGTERVWTNGTAEASDLESDRTARTTTVIPAAFAVFSKAPRVATLGQSLLDFPFEIWKVGYDGWPYPFRVDTSGQVGTILSRGERQRALATIPPEKGKTIATFALQLPDHASRLRFLVGLADPSPPLPPTVDYSRADVAVRINGEKVWNSTLEVNGWFLQFAAVSKWSGQKVIIELEADSQSNAIFDWVHWAGLTIE
jgi:hypothetical protein